ncbi:hypothetical protein C8Q72DRAFT_447202 [Fomitopsis betulina]|nr:hypothetical protein C8Q72DRAFT_447202 [Fomitopsis betulina]
MANYFPSNRIPLWSLLRLVILGLLLWKLGRRALAPASQKEHPGRPLVDDGTYLQCKYAEEPRLQRTIDIAEFYHLW